MLDKDVPFWKQYENNVNKSEKVVNEHGTMDWIFCFFRPHFTQAAPQLVASATTVSPTTVQNGTNTSQQPQQQVPLVQPNVPSTNPGVSNVCQPVLGYLSSNPGQQIGQGATATLAPSAASSGKGIRTEAEIASNVSFRSLHPKQQL